MQAVVSQIGLAEQIQQLWSPEGFVLSDVQLEQLVLYLELLNKWNRVHSLTAIEDPQEQVCRHILDALLIWPSIAARFGKNSSIQAADVGAGMGVPGLVLAIVMPNIRVDLIERNQKKAAFLRQAASRLGLAARVGVIDRDVSLIRPNPEYRLITSRAFAALPDFLQLTMGISGQETLWAAMLGHQKHEKSEHILLRNGTDTVNMIVKDVIKLEPRGFQAARHLAWIGRAN